MSLSIVTQSLAQTRHGAASLSAQLPVHNLSLGPNGSLPVPVLIIAVIVIVGIGIAILVTRGRTK